MVRLTEAARPDFTLIELLALERRLEEILGAKVDVVVEPIRRSDFARTVERDRTVAF